MILAPLLALVSLQTADVPSLMTITVQKLPASFKENPVVHLEFADDGSVATCTVEQPSGSAGIDKVACQQAQLGMKVKVEGKKKPEPRSGAIEFVTEAPQG